MYGRTQRKAPPWFVCGSHGACLPWSMLKQHVPGVQVTPGLEFLGRLSDSEDSDSLLLRGLVPKRGLVPL